MRIEEDGSLNIPREEVELLISYVRKALLIPSKNTNEETQSTLRQWANTHTSPNHTHQRTKSVKAAWEYPNASAPALTATQSIKTSRVNLTSLDVTTHVVRKWTTGRLRRFFTTWSNGRVTSQSNT